MPTEANTANTEVLKKRARQIIDAVIESPVIIEVRAFSQPEEVDKLEDRIAALLIKPLMAPAAPDERDKALAQVIVDRIGDHVWRDAHGVLRVTCDFDKLAAALATVRAEERSACIEKVKETADDWLKQAIAERDVERSDKLRMSYNVAQTIIEALKAAGEQPCTTKSN